MSASDNLKLLKLFNRATPDDQKDILRLIGVESLTRKHDLKNVPYQAIQKAIGMLSKYEGVAQTPSTTKTTLEQDCAAYWNTIWSDKEQNGTEDLSKALEIARAMTQPENFGHNPRQLPFNKELAKWALYARISSALNVAFLEVYCSSAGFLCNISENEWKKMAESAKTELELRAFKANVQAAKPIFSHWATQKQIGTLGLEVFITALDLALNKPLSYFSYLSGMPIPMALLYSRLILELLANRAWWETRFNEIFG